MTLNIPRTLRAAIIAVVVVAGSAARADAAVIIDFQSGLTGAGGVYTVLGGGHASGTNIPVGALTISGLGSFDGAYDTTGSGPSQALMGFGVIDGGNGSAVLNFNTLTNTIDIVGGIAGPIAVAAGTLLSGTFLGFTADADGLQTATGTLTMNEALLTALGLPSSTPFEFLGFALTTPANGESSAIVSTDIRATAVPEPGSMLLLGTGLLGLGSAARRRMNKRRQAAVVR